MTSEANSVENRPADSAGDGGELETSEGDIHVTPIGDLRDHISCVHCWCRPTVEDGEGPAIVIHNSMDRREHTIEKGITQ